MMLYKTVNNGRTSIVGRAALEPPSAKESSLITPKPTGFGGVYFNCYGMGKDAKTHTRHAVELTRRDLEALCEAAGLKVQP